MFHLQLTGELEPSGSEELREHLSGCDTCREEFEMTERLWELMAASGDPQPSGSMREKFYSGLQEYKSGMRNRLTWLDKLKDRVSASWYLFPRPGLALNSVIIIAAFILGLIVRQPVKKTDTSYLKQIDSLSSQVSEIRQMMMLSLLDNPSASQRIKAVKFTDDIPQAGKKVTDALFTTLNNDPDVNVRLVTLEALIRYASDPSVRQGLVESISKQDSPVMQAAISEVMVRLSEKRSIPELKKLLGKEGLNKFVKQNLQKNLNKLI